MCEFVPASFITVGAILLLVVSLLYLFNSICMLLFNHDRFPM